MKYVKKFANESEYNAYITSASAETPCLALSEEEWTVHSVPKSNS